MERFKIVDQQASAPPGGRESISADDPIAVADRAARWGAGILARLPRPETICLLFALLCTVGAKLITVRRHFPPSVPLAWVSVIWTDILFFSLLIVVTAGGYRLRPRSGTARVMLVVSVVVLFWSVLNTAWLLATGVQLQPSIIPALGYDPRQFAGIIEDYILRYLPISIACATVVLAVIGWLVVRMVRPVRIRHENGRRLRPVAMAVLLIPAAWFAGKSATAGAELSFETHAALGFSSHWYALASLFTGPTEQAADETATRYVPRVGERDIRPPDPPREKWPNIVLILLESVSHDSSSFGPAGRNTTPHLEQIASEGVRFVNTRVPVSQTGKAYWATLSGATPEIHHDYSEALLVDKPYESIATLLRNSGYRSAFFEMSNGTFECAPAVFVNMGFDYGWWFENLEDPSAALGYLAGDDFRMIDPAMAWTEEEDAPFLLMMITSVAHDPFEVPAWYGENSGDRWQDYLHSIRYTDDFVRAVDERLKERGIFDDTIMCVIGDHGEGFRADARRGRWVPYEEVIRVPWVLRWPGHVAAGREIDWPCSQLDVTPTLLSLLGFDISRAGFDGLDALSPIDPNRRLYFSSWFDKSPLGFVEGDRKVVYWPYLNQVGQYDLETDPGEMHLELLEGPAGDEAIADVTRWRMESRLFFDARRFRERLVFDHWHIFASGRSAWAYYVP